MIKKHLFKILCVVFIIILSIYVCFFAIKKVQDYEIYKEPQVNTKIYTIWHIETFEGGGKPRIQYLKTAARAIEKQNDGVLFMISQISPENLELKLKASTPDIISFGFGLGKIVLPYLQEFNNSFNIRDELLNSAIYGKNLMALPFISSGYALISHAGEVKEYCYGLNAYTKPENIFENDVSPVAYKSQYDAYKNFVYNKKTALFGTARDVFRVNNLNNIGRTNALILPNNKYTDLVQYVGLVLKDNFTLKFAEFLLSDKHQETLKEYSLFGVKNNKLYSSGIYNDMENAIFSCRVPNVFNE